MSVVSNNRTSILVTSQLPAFVTEDHARFVEFVEYYYKFLEEREFLKKTLTNLKVSTPIGPPHINVNTATVSANAGFSNVVFANGSYVRIGGVKTKVSNYNANSRTFTVTPKVPPRINSGDFYVYETALTTPATEVDSGLNLYTTGSAGHTTNTAYLTQATGLSNASITVGTWIKSGGYKTKVVSANQSNSVLKVYPHLPSGLGQNELYVIQTDTWKGEMMSTTKNLNRLLDVDVAKEENPIILQKLYDNFIKNVPANMLADKNLLLKHAKEFYRSRGSENSIKFLLRALYNKEADFYYPKQDILKASDGKWYVEKALRVRDFAVSNVANNMVISVFRGRQIRGATSRAFAYVEDISTVYRKGELVTELKISNSTREFLSNEIIWTRFDEDGQEKYVSARIYGGNIVDTDIENGGTAYEVDQVIPVIPTGNTGTGAKIVISRVSGGSIAQVFVKDGYSFNGGCGYRIGDIIDVEGGGGTGAIVDAEFVWDNNEFHPNSYQICITSFNDPYYSNVIINDVKNTTLANGFSFYTYDETGPIRATMVWDGGNDYTGTPTFTPRGNNMIRSLGILGKLKVITPGTNYTVGDKIEFTNRIGSFGVGARAQVTAVYPANGGISQVNFIQVPGHYIGGSGYREDNLPVANVISATGSGANVIAQHTLGFGGEFTFTTESIGIIKQIKIIDEGTGYTTPPILDLTGFGDGNARVTATVVTGLQTYPGRYINDDGFLSAHNYLEDRDYYQNFAYEVRTDYPLASYQTAVKNLAHPAGMKMWGRYLFTDTNQATMNTSQVFSSSYDTGIVLSNLKFHIDSANNAGAATGRWKNLANTNPAAAGYLTNGAALDHGILYIDGTNDYVSFQNDANLNSQTLTVETWMDPISWNQKGVVFEKGTMNSQYNLQLENGYLIWRAIISNKATNMIKIKASDYIDATQWAHIVATANNISGTQSLYYNGILIGRGATKGTIATSTGGMSVGTFGGYNSSVRGYYYSGRIAAVRVYTKTLSQSEVTKNFNSERGRFGL